MEGCSTRPCQQRGERLFDKAAETTFATLSPEDGGKWNIWRGPRYGYEPVELVAPTLDALADFAQELRDKAPEIEGTCLHSRFVNSGLTMTLDRQYVLEAIFIIAPRGLDHHAVASVEPTREPHDPLEVGPLLSARFAVRDWCAWLAREGRYSIGGDAEA